MWPAKQPENIIVRMPNWLGDLVMATPVLANLRERYKLARITAMCQSGVGKLIEHDPHIDELFVFNKPSGWLHRDEYRNIITPLQHGKYDLGVLLTNSFSSTFRFWKGSVKNRIGFSKNMRCLFLNKAVPFPKNLEKQHLVQTYQMLLAPLGIEETHTAPKLYITDNEVLAAKMMLEKYGVQNDNIIIGINPGAAYGSAKCWLPERFKEVTEKLLTDPQVRVVYFGDKVGAPLVNEICNGFDGRVLNMAGKTSLRELMALISLCRVFLTNDSGPMHIASALETPLVALFGSTSDVKTGPYSGGTVIHKHVSCSPCYKRVCPIDFKCMKQIGVDEVYQTIKERKEENRK
jgi:heptosyltransferase-2